MNKKKRILDVIFIAIAGASVLVLNHFGLISEYPGLSLIPLLMAYFIGQFVERKTKAK